MRLEAADLPPVPQPLKSGSQAGYRCGCSYCCKDVEVVAGARDGGGGGERDGLAFQIREEAGVQDGFWLKCR